MLPNLGKATEPFSSSSMSNNADKAESKHLVTLPDEQTVDSDDKILRGE